MSVSNTFQNRLFEVQSALQKCIRRGLEEQAVFFALELAEWNENWVWNRLRIMASEDVGCANPMMPVIVETLRKHYFEAKSSVDSSFVEATPLFLVNVVVILCRSPHSRIADDLYHKVKDSARYLPIPDFALDGIHTRRCTKEGKEHWDGVVNEPFPNPYRKKKVN